MPSSGAPLGAAAPRLTLTRPHRERAISDRRPEGSSLLCPRWAGGVSTGIEGLARDGATGEDTRVEMPPQRLASTADAEEIQALMQASIRAHFPRFYDPRHTESAARYIGELDMTLIEDGTYYVHEAGGELVACGGWSRRNRLYTGSGAAADDGRLLDPATEPARVRAMFVRGDWTRRGLGRALLDSCERAARAEGFRELVLMATLPGEPLYRAYGFREVARTMVRLPDGVELEGVAMERPCAPS